MRAGYANVAIVLRKGSKSKPTRVSLASRRSDNRRQMRRELRCCKRMPTCGIPLFAFKMPGIFKATNSKIPNISITWRRS